MTEDLDNPRPDVTGVLRNARRVSRTEDPRGPCLAGQVYGDTKGRFRDGERITTSTIIFEADGLFVTRFSAYRVESWAHEAAKTNAPLSTLRTANQARQKEWDAGNQLTLEYRGNELAGEVGEACNVIKKLVRERLGIAGSRDTVAHLAEELADVVICADLIAMSVGINLPDAIVAKFNATSEKVGLNTRLVAA